MTSPTGQHDYFRLRAEWLRFKNQVFDANTELPTLAAVLDDVRRLMEENDALGLIYLDLSGDGQIEGLHGWEAYDDLLRAFAATLAGLRTDGLLGPRDIVSVMSVRSDKFLLFVGSAPGAPLEAGFPQGMAERLCDYITRSLPARLPAALTAPVTFHHGHSVMYRDPMLRAERAVHRALDQAMYMSLKRRASDEDRRAQGLSTLIEREQVQTLYQPILDLRDLTMLGHEVFTRGPAGGPFEDPERLFVAAGRSGRLLDVERLCRRRALRSVRQHLPRGRKLFLNTSAGTLGDSAVGGAEFVRMVEQEGLSHADVVLEISERVALQERQANLAVLRSLKDKGFGIAIDDMGTGYSSLQSLVEVEPDYLKFDVSFVRNIDRSLIKRSLLETLVDLASRIGAQVIAEGIEAESELQTLREMGVRLGQGHYLAAPLPVPAERAPAL